MKRLSIKRILLRALCVFSFLLLAAYVGFSPLVWPELYRSRVFHTAYGKGDIRALRAYKEYPNREVWFSAEDGTRLHGWLFVNPGSKKVLLYHPGNVGDIPKRLPTVELLLHSNASVFIYEPRGFGMSPGTPSQRTICDDGISAYDYLTGALGYKPGQVVLYGESLGSGVATYVSTKRHVSGIILQSGFSSLEEIGRQKMPIVKIYPWFMLPQPRLNNVAILRKPHAPLLIVHGEKDTLIPIEHSEKMYREAAQPKQFVRFPHSTHSSISPDDALLFRKTISAFLNGLP